MRLKKSQMEIMGLAIIVILISLSFLFVLRFNITKKPEKFHEEFTQIEMASNFLNTLLQTTAPNCYKLSFKELFQDCGKGPTLICEDKDSCQYLEEKTSMILGKTLDVWGIKYEFNAYTKEDSPKISLGKCEGEKRSKLFPLPLSTSSMYLRLDVC